MPAPARRGDPMRHAARRTPTDQPQAISTPRKTGTATLSPRPKSTMAVIPGPLSAGAAPRPRESALASSQSAPEQIDRPPKGGNSKSGRTPAGRTQFPRSGNEPDGSAVRSPPLRITGDPPCGNPTIQPGRKNAPPQRGCALRPNRMKQAGSTAPTTKSDIRRTESPAVIAPGKPPDQPGGHRRLSGVDTSRSG